MKILFLGINYWPEETGIAVFNTGRCEYLAAHGHEVAMYTGMPYYPQWRIAAGYRGKPFGSETRNGVRVLRSWLFVPRRVTSVRRILHEGSFIATATMRALGAWKPEILVVVAPPLGLAFPAILLSRLWRSPYVFHVEDLQPDAAIDLGLLRPGRLASALYSVERLAYRKAAMVTTITEGMRARIVSKGIAADKVEVMSEWADAELFSVPRVSSGERFRRKHRLEQRFLVVHAGNMGVKQALEVVLGAARRSSQLSDILYLLVGDGSVRAVLESRVRAEGLDKVRFMPLLPSGEFLDMLAAADLCLVTQQSAVGDIVFPSKVRTLMAARRPIVASVGRGSEVAQIIAGSGAGLVVPPEDPEALVGAIMRLRAAPEARAAMGAGGRAYALEHWDRERILPTMVAQLESFIGQARPVQRRELNLQK